MPAGIRSVLRNSGFVFVGYSWTTLLAFAYAIALARLLGEHAYGVLAFAFAWYLGFLSLSHLGLDVVLGRGIGRSRAEMAHLAGSTLAVRCAAAILAALASSTLGVILEPDPTTRALLTMFALAVVARAIWLWCVSMFTATERMSQGILGDLLCRPVEPVLGVIALLIAPRSVLAVGIVHVLVWCAQAAFGMYLVTHKLTPVRLQTACADMVSVLCAGAPAAVYSITIVWFLQGPIIMFQRAAGDQNLGNFGLAMQVLGYLLVIPSLVSTVALPVLTRSAARNDGRTHAVAVGVAVGIPVVGLVLSLAAMWLAPPVMSAVFGHQFRVSGVILGEAAWLLIPMGVAVGMQQIAFARGGFTKQALAANACAVLLMASLFAPLTHRWGYHGAIIATATGLSFWAVGIAAPVLAHERRLTREQAHPQL